MISSTLSFEQPCGQVGQGNGQGAAIGHLFRIRHLLTAGVIKPTELIILFQRKHENEFIWVKLVIILNVCNEKVVYVACMSKR